jgi:heme exporter protein B
MGMNLVLLAPARKLEGGGPAISLRFSSSLTPLFMLREILALLRKELLIEWKQKYALNGLLLYVVSMVVVITLALVDQLNPVTWNILYWILLLFVSINAVAKSFMSERPGNLLYLYALASPAAIIIAKMIYNFLLLTFMAVVTLLAFAFLSGIHIDSWPLMLAIVTAGSAALAANLTLVSAIAAKAENRTTLLAVLSFPLIVPILMVLIDLSENAIQGLDISLEQNSFLLLGGIVVALSGVSVLLFPFVWRD